MISCFFLWSPWQLFSETGHWLQTGKVQGFQCWETEIFHQRPLRAFQCLPMTPSSTQEGKSIFLQLDGEEPEVLSCWSPEKHGFVSFDGLAEHTRKHRHGCGHSKLDLALPCARISQMSITKANTTIKLNSNARCIFLHVIPFPNEWINTFIEFN